MIKNKTLIVVESPGKVKTISKYLGSDYVVRASVGHIKDLVSGGRYGIGVDIDNEFKLHYQITKSKKDVVNSIIDATTLAKEIVIASDNDREGCAICADLIDIFSSTGLPIKRAIFNEITKKAILAGLQNAGELDWNMVAAARARRALDRIVGYLVSPFIIDTLGPSLSAGRVQSVAVRMVVDREREIEVFKPEEYWNISSTLAKPSSLTESFQTKYVSRVTTKAVADKVKQDLETGDYQVSAVELEEKKRKPLPPLITVSLQTSAASKYKFPAAKTMKSAQMLYEAGLITYMRTDSYRLSPEAVTECRNYLTKQSYGMPTTPNTYSSKGGAQDAHEAIRPSDVFKLPQNVFLGDDEQKIYRLIWERFVASQMNPALYDTVAVTVKTSNGHILKANGKTLKYKGWLEVTGDTDGGDDNDTKLPVLKAGDKLTLVPPKVKAEQKATQPPPRYSEKLLIEELEKRGIGRPSTYAAIMSKITDRNYVTRKVNVFIPTDLGKKVVDNLVKYFDFVEYKYTADMELQLDKIADGKSDYLTTMQNFYTPFSVQLKKAYSANTKDYGFTCDKCQEKMELKHGKFGFYMACADYPNKCKNTFSCELVNEKPVKKSSAPIIVEGTECPKCGCGMIKKDGKFGPFYSCSTYPKCDGKAKVPFGKKCPNCSDELYMTIYNNETILFCMGYNKVNCRYKEKCDIKLLNPSTLEKKDFPKVVSNIIAKKYDKKKID